MKYLQRLVIISVLIGLSIGRLSAQYSMMAESEIELDTLFTHLVKAQSDSARVIINDSIITGITTMMTQDNSFNYPFERLDYFGKIYSRDKKIRIYSWCFPAVVGLNFYCIIQNDKGKWEMLHNGTPYMPTENALITNRNWYGALYYHAIPHKIKIKQGKKKQKLTYYMLAGWGRDRNDKLQHYKVMDVLHIDDDGNFNFGAPFFKDSERITNRRVFQYDAQTGMSLEPDSKGKAFYVDHLSPLKLDEQGYTLTWGVDMSVDVFQRKKNLWVLKENVKAKNKK